MERQPVSPPITPVQSGKRLRILRWIARVWSVLVAIITILLFLGPGSGLNEQVPPTEWLVMGLVQGIPALGLLLAWKWEGFGGSLCLGSFLLGLLLDFILHGYGPGWTILLFLLAVWVTPGILFLVCWRESRKIG